MSNGLNKVPKYFRWMFWWQLFASISLAFVIWSGINYFREPSQDRIFTFLLTIPAAAGFGMLAGVSAMMKDIFKKEEWHRL